MAMRLHLGLLARFSCKIHWLSLAGFLIRKDFVDIDPDMHSKDACNIFVRSLSDLKSTAHLMVPSGLETGTRGLTQQSSSVTESLNFDQVIILVRIKILY